MVSFSDFFATIFPPFLRFSSGPHYYTLTPGRKQYVILAESKKSWFRYAGSSSRFLLHSMVC